MKLKGDNIIEITELPANDEYAQYVRSSHYLKTYKKEYEDLRRK